MSVDSKYLYAIQHPHGYVKVGKGSNPKRRANGVQVGSPYDLELRFMVKYHEPSVLLDEVDLENHVHEELREFSVRGEWFEISIQSLRHFLARVCEDDSLPGYDLIDVEREKDRKSRYKSTTGIRYKGPL